ncbi:tetratricopeptide repeat protein [Sphingomonas sp. RP10(2022)]|uniref:Tetratricopeptide repeat protein n=1 Tax=Sphingomonas liriopis TaxID=2949094 RepID=A0A9X2HPG1_9SPHN|nr:tetratricopeptide repeat protein [Sphingomonas liriopis]MCP3733967.1 tetratricopeptide repeat protein [Sphingomonas liriopis]
MALTPQNNEAFLREVDDELRRDQLMTFWERYGRWTIAAVVVALAAFAGFLYWQHRRAEAAGVQGEQLQVAYDALGNTQPDAAAKTLAPIASEGRDGYKALALMTQADILLSKKQDKAAAAKFAAIAGDASIAQPFRDLALIRQTVAEYDTLKPQVVIERLRSLAVPGNAYFGSAGELVAIAYLDSGRKDLAGPLFGQLAQSETVPDSIRQRAVQMAGTMGVDAAAASVRVVSPASVSAASSKEAPAQ